MRKREGQAPCPSCKGPMFVINSRPIPNGIMRRRKCPQDHRISTFEMFTGPINMGENIEPKEDLESALIGLGLSITLAKAIVIQHRIAQAKK